MNKNKTIGKQQNETGDHSGVADGRRVTWADVVRSTTKQHGVARRSNISRKKEHSNNANSLIQNP